MITPHCGLSVRISVLREAFEICTASLPDSIKKTHSLPPYLGYILLYYIYIYCVFFVPFMAPCAGVITFFLFGNHDLFIVKLRSKIFDICTKCRYVCMRCSRVLPVTVVLHEGLAYLHSSVLTGDVPVSVSCVAPLFLHVLNDDAVIYWSVVVSSIYANSGRVFSSCGACVRLLVVVISVRDCPSDVCASVVVKRGHECHCSHSV